MSDNPVEAVYGKTLTEARSWLKSVYLDTIEYIESELDKYAKIVSDLEQQGRSTPRQRCRDIQRRSRRRGRHCLLPRHAPASSRGRPSAGLLRGRLRIQHSGKRCWYYRSRGLRPRFPNPAGLSSLCLQHRQGIQQNYL